jgi:Zn-dependent protease
MNDELTIVQQLAVLAIPVLIAITFHEAAHGFAARYFGDDTAERAGRLTLNPLNHIELVGTILLPVVLFFATSGAAMFGWAKPVPVRFDRLQPRRLGQILVAFAGPGINLLLALLSAILLVAIPPLSGPTFQWVDTTLAMSVRLNVILAIVNLLPIPPLDGGRIVAALLPEPLQRTLDGYERHGLILVALLLLVLPILGPQLGIDVNILSWLVDGPSRYVQGVIESIAGIHEAGPEV